MIYKNIALISTVLGIGSSFAVENFDSAQGGNFTSLQTEYGKLSASDQNAGIHNKGRSGDKSLRLLGGDNKQVELTLKEAPKIDVDLSAWAERWSGKTPFEFSIKAVGPYGEKEIYNGTKALKTGGFNTQIKCKVPAKTTKLIFASNTADNTGVLLDDLYIVPCVPMKFKKTGMHSDVWPAMVRLDENPILRVDVETEGGLKPMKITGATFDMTGTNMADIDSITLFNGTEKVSEKRSDMIGSPLKGVSNPKSVKFEGNTELTSGNNHLWLSVRLKDKAKVGGKVVAKPVSVTLNGKPVAVADSKPVAQRIGYAVVKGGDQVLPTRRASKNFRIPAMVRTKKGTLLAASDIRYNHSGDLPADIDMGVSRSTDGGQTWSPMEIALPFKDAVKGYKGAGNGDAAMLVDESNGRIWMAVLWSHGKHPIWHSEQGSNSPDKVSQLVLIHSDDDGKTWSKATNITDQIKKEEWGVNFQGPGSGICLKDGTLVFPCQFWYDVNGRRKAHCSIIYSKDHGKTWEVGTSPVMDTSEAQVVELADGSIMINSRNEARNGWRVVYTTKDFGKTWEEHPTNKNNDGNGLAEPGACQGSILTVANKGGVAHPLFFSNPNSHNGRKNMTLKASLDQGKTWPEKFQILYDERNGAGYSSLAPVDDKNIGVFYEGNDNIYFLKFPYAEIFNSKK